MADNKYQGITWDEPSTPEKKEPAGVTWDKPSVFQAMKQGAEQAFSPEGISELGKNIPPNVAAKIAAAARFGTGVARIPANLMNMAGVEGPSKFVKAVDEGAKNLTESAGYTGMLPGLANLGGEIALGGGALKLASKAAPVLEAIPGGAAMVKGIKESPSAQAILGGMGLGAAGSSGSAYDVAKEASLGGIFGLGGQAVASTLGHAAAPVLSRYKELKGLGYSDAEILKDSTIGQLLGGNVQKLENLLSDIPFSGVAKSIEKGTKSLYGALESKLAPIFQRQKSAENVLDTSMDYLKAAETRALNDAAGEAQLAIKARQNAEMAAHKATGADVHVPALNYALEPLGKTIDPKLTGHEANNQMIGFIKDAYKESLGGMSNLRLSKPVQEDLRSLTNTWKGKLTPDVQKLLSNDIEQLIASTSKGKWLTPENWQNNLSNLSADAYKMSLKEPRYGQALYELKDKWMDIIEGQVGSEMFKAANTAFSRSKIPEKAASYGKSIKAEGQVEPNELINAARSELSTSRLAGGENEIQRMAVEANKKYLAEKAAIEGKQGAENLAFSTGNTQQSRALEDKFTGMGSSLAAQKAALKTQAEKQAGKQEAAIGAAAGPESLGSDWASRRLGYSLGAGSLGVGGFGLTRLGVDPLTALGLGGATLGGLKSLYSSPVQNYLKQKAIAPRSEATKAVGEALKENAPLSGLTVAQERQRIAKEKEQNAPLGALPVPK